MPDLLHLDWRLQIDGLFTATRTARTLFRGVFVCQDLTSHSIGGIGNDTPLTNGIATESALQ